MGPSLMADRLELGLAKLNDANVRDLFNCRDVTEFTTCI